MTKESSAKAPTFGPMFAKVGTDGSSYKLKDFTAVGMDPYGDMIQFLDSDSAATYIQAVYLDGATYGAELDGWWDIDDVGGTSLNEQELPAGTAFLGYIGSGNTVAFNFSGEVEKGRTIVTTTKAPFIANPTPVNLTLKDITAVGMDPYGDMIQFLDSDSAATYIQAVYLDGATYGAELDGWWDIDDVGGTSLNETPVPAGSGFLGFIGSGNTVTFVFPDPLATK